MDAYEATKVVFSQIQALDPDHAAKIMGWLLIQDHGDKEMIRLAFGPEALLHTVMAKARNDLGLGSAPATPTSPAHSPFLLSRQNSSRCGAGTAPSPLSVSSSPSSWAPPPVFSRSNSNGGAAAADDALAAGLGGEDLMSPAGSGGNAPPSPFFAAGDPVLDELQLQEQLAFLNDDAAGDAGGFFPYYAGGGGPGHRRSSSVSELCCLGGGGGAADGLGCWKPCLYYARGYCKNGSACRFVHGGGGGLLPEKLDAAAALEDMLLRSKSQRLAAAAGGFTYSRTGSATKCLSLLLQQQQEKQRVAAAAAASMAMNPNPGSRQIYLTFPADSTFREEDVSSYFSMYGPVQDVRIPYQQKRMFGFVTFVFPETVRLILGKGNPHFICDARVLVKPYKEKARLPADKYRKQPLDFDRDHHLLDVHHHHHLAAAAGARILQHSQSANEMLLRRKLEEQQQQELQQAMELQTRRLMGLQLLDLNLNLKPASPMGGGMPLSPTRAADRELQQQGIKGRRAAVNGGGDKEESASPNADSDQSGCEHNLPDSPFASPTKKASASFSRDPFDAAVAASSPGRNPLAGINNGGHLSRPSALDIPSPKPYFFPMSRLSSDHGAGAIGM